MYQTGDTVYVPVKAADLHRASLPAYGQGLSDTQSPVQRASAGSPGPQYGSVNHYDSGQQPQSHQQDHQRNSLGPMGPIQEMDVPEQKHP